MRRVIILKYKQIEYVDETRFYSQKRYKFEKVEDREGLFHQFGLDYEEFGESVANYSIGIVELSDGTIVNVKTDLLKFIDQIT